MIHLCRLPSAVIHRPSLSSAVLLPSAVLRLSLLHEELDTHHKIPRQHKIRLSSACRASAVISASVAASPLPPPSVCPDAVCLPLPSAFIRRLSVCRPSPAMHTAVIRLAPIVTRLQSVCRNPSAVSLPPPFTVCVPYSMLPPPPPHKMLRSSPPRRLGSRSRYLVSPPIRRHTHPLPPPAAIARGAVSSVSVLITTATDLLHAPTRASTFCSGARLLEDSWRGCG